MCYLLRPSAHISLGRSFTGRAGFEAGLANFLSWEYFLHLDILTDVFSAKVKNNTVDQNFDLYNLHS